MRALDLCLLAGTCAFSVILATPTPATSQSSDLSLVLGQFGAAAVEEVRHRPYRYAHRGYYRPYYYRPHYYDPRDDGSPDPGVNARVLNHFGSGVAKGSPGNPLLSTFADKRHTRWP